MIRDVPSPIDLRLMSDAREWESTAMSKRPSRVEFFAQFALAIKSAAVPVHRVLELGSGPGFLAEHLLRTLPAIDYIALDFSSAMHQLASERLGSLGARVQFVQRSFRDPEWPIGLGQFECVVTLQAVHELRHKHYASELHTQVRQLLTAGGMYLVCDHFLGDGGMKNDQLYMTVAEQHAALGKRGIFHSRAVTVKGRVGTPPCNLTYAQAGLCNSAQIEVGK